MTVFDSGGLSVLATLSVPGAFKLLSIADGSQHYFISNVSGAAITVTDRGFGIKGHVQQIGNFANPLNTAVLSPDGSWLIAGENTVHIFLTSNNTDLTPNGISIGNGGPISDLVVSYDSQTAYALQSSTGKIYVAAIDLSQQAVTSTLTITGQANALALGPNGYLYVSAVNQVIEVDPLTLKATSGGTISVTASPGRLEFTPDGNYALAVNQTPATGPAVQLFSLGTHTLAGFVPYAGLNFPLDTLFITSSTQVYAYSTAGQSLYTLDIGSTGGLILGTPNIPGVNLTAISAVGFSTDLGIPGRNAPQFLFAVSNGTLYRIDPVSGLASLQTVLTSAPGLLSYFTKTATTNTPYTTLQYGNNQTVLPGATAAPLVVRVLDQNGLPISGVGVSFTTTSGSITPAAASTGADGYAEAILVAGTDPSELGALSASATIGSLSASWIGTVGTNAPATPAALTITSGQGQLVLVDPTGATPVGSVAPFTVLATDANNNPVPNAVITFTISGDGTLATANPGQTSVAVVTDGTGQASANFVPPLAFPSYPGFESATIAATAGSASQNFFITTLAEDTLYCGAPPCTPTFPLTFQVSKPASNGTVAGSAYSLLKNAVQVSVLSSFGVAIPNAGVQVNTGPDPTVPNSNCADPTGANMALTNSNGIASCDLVLNGVPGTMPLNVTLPVVASTGTGLTYSNYNLTISQGVPAKIVATSGDNQIAITGSYLSQPLIVMVMDANNNPLLHIPVSWQVISGNLVLSGASPTTDLTGSASTTGFVNSPPGNTIMVNVTAGSAVVTLSVLVAAQPGGLSIVSGNRQSTQINTAFSSPLVVVATDLNGNPAPYEPITFSVDVGSATILSTSVNADQNGQASTKVTAGQYAGSVTITATAGGSTAVFTLTVLPLGPTGVSILNSASLTPGIAPGGLVTLIGAGLAPTITGVVTDPEQMAGYSVTISIAPGVAPSSAPILALINENGLQQINAQVPFDIQPGPNAVTIQTPQGSTTLTGININPLAPGIFTNGTLSANGKTYPLAAATRPDGSYVSASNPAQRGETVTIWATGLGQTDPGATTGVPGVPGQVVTSTLFAGVNHQGVEVLSAVYQPNMIGVYAVTLLIPATSLTGPAQPLSLSMEDASFNAYTAPDVYVPIQ